MKDVRSHLRLKKEIDGNTVKDIRNLFRPKKKYLDRTISYIGNLFEYEEENYYKPVRINNFWSNNYIEFESNSDKNKTLSVENCINK